MIFGKEAMLMMMMDMHQAIPEKQQEGKHHQLDGEKDVLNIQKDCVKNTTTTSMGHNLEAWTKLSPAHPLPVLYHKHILNKLRTCLNFLKSQDYGYIYNVKNREYICWSDRLLHLWSNWGYCIGKKMPARKVGTRGLMIQNWCNQHYRE